MSDDVNELLKIVGNTNEVPAAKKSRDPGVFRFVTDHKIVAGTDKVPQPIIYELYKGATLEPTSYSKFFKEFKKYFPQKRSNSVRFYELDKTPFNLPEDYSIYKIDSGFAKSRAKQTPAEREQLNNDQKEADQETTKKDS